MYTPRHTEETRVEVLHALIQRYPLGTLVAMTPQGLEASHVPFEIDPEPAPYGTLRCHLARANPLWRTLAEGGEALVIFQGPESYISPAWYPSKREHGKVVPTWNYVAVHAYGSPTVFEDAASLRGLVDALTRRHEAGRPEPWAVSDAPADYVEKLLGAIVGVQIPVARLFGKWKLSQQASVADRQGTVAGLERENKESSSEVARLMRKALE